MARSYLGALHSVQRIGVYRESQYRRSKSRAGRFTVVRSWCRFRLGTLVWFVVVVAVICAWRRDHLAQYDAMALLRGELLNAGKREAQWGVEQLVGPPDTTGAGDLVTAWASASPDNQKEWIMLDYSEAVQPTEIVVHETFNPGALTQVSIFDPMGREVIVWKGTDPTSPLKQRGISKIPVRSWWPTKRVKLYFDSPAVPGWNEIDAVGLRDTDHHVQWAWNATASSAYGGRESKRQNSFTFRFGR